ncbi:glutamate-5-semialdehyde dehydrogenase [Desulfovibrio sulfodismutans]|uniref:Gamma-glutamyl phosphate reductase n=1 Tax=Desulfolutivibrio sulfodismutans TaxID=63561 RepID=A0A7K3NP43_9BACT|nr:glutamate-5-semialdehyde dehydrogenase [Desulfolutivibrio sulfodismutans]NDY56969.1 glutamate-5-semialdehyde dehydrogenase [Desulfolutivibrio sulfodismutans]QLA12084.1 glutamate-5-semialdehyde dehydrogenase [Desulfolutivibrio sulfodismutans DSM 3696]
MDAAAAMLDLAKRAKRASRLMAGADPAVKARALHLLADLLAAEPAGVYEANALDLEKAAAAGLDAPRLDRLRLTPAIMAAMAKACREVADMPDPVGGIDALKKRENGLLVGRMRIPLGVVCMIYESRPNVTIDAAILCLKAGNAVILKGGSEALASNMALAGLMQKALAQAGLPGDAACLVETSDRAAVAALCKLDVYIDVMIPRGGEGLIRAVSEQATMPVLKHYKGVCHAYLDAEADEDQALAVVVNAKAQRPGVCNALECLLVHADRAASFLPRAAEALARAGVGFRACPRSLPLLGEGAVAAAPGDFGHEFHDLILAVKVVDSMDEALDHIAAFGSNHTEVILTTNHDRAMAFLRLADASMVGVNCSTRFNDGGELGLGAEIGISTSKLHAYGPMGVTELTGAKFVVLGQGQVRG